MAVMIEVISKESIDQVKQLLSVVDQNIQAVTKLNNTFKTVVPSDVSKGVNDYNQAIKSSNKTVSEADKLQRKLIQSEQNRLNSLTKTNKEIIANRLAVRKANQEARIMAELNSKLTGEFRKQEIRLNSLRTQYKNLAISEGESSKESRRLLKEITKLDGRLKKVSASAGQFQKNVGNYPRALGAAANSALNLARAMGFVGGAFLIASTVRGAIKVFNDFDQSQADLAAVLGKSRNEITALTAQAKELGATTAFTATQVAELQLELSKLGFNESEILAATRGVENLAIATGVDAARAAKLAGAAIRGFGLDASESNRVAAALAVSTTKSASSFETLEVSLPKVSAIAKSFGFTIEDTTALLGGLQNAGFEASTAGTSLRSIFLNLADSNGKLAKRLGGGAKNFDELIGQFKEAEASGIDLSEALELTDKRSVNAFKIFLEGADDLKTLRDSIVDVEDELTDLADTKLDSVQGRVTLLNSAWEGWILNLDESGEASRTVNKTLDFLTNNLASILNTIVKVIKGFVVYKATVIGLNVLTKVYTASTTALRIAKIALAGGTRKATIAMKAFNVATKANPVGLLIAGLAAVVGLFVAFKDGAEEAAEAQRALNATLEEAGRKSKEAIEAEINSIKGKLKAIDDSVDNETNATQKKINLLNNEIEKRKELEDDFTEQTENRKKSIGDLVSLEEGANKRLSDSRRASLDRIKKDTIDTTKDLKDLLGNDTDDKSPSISVGDFSKAREESKALKELRKELVISLNKINRSASKDNSDKQRKDAFDLARFRLKTEIDTQKAIRDNVNLSQEERLSANNRVVQLQNELSLTEKKFAISNAKGRENLITKAIEEEQLKRKGATKEFSDSVSKIVVDGFKKRVEELNKLTDTGNTKLLEKETALRNKLLEAGASSVDIEKELTKLRREEQKKQLDNQIEFAVKELEAFAITTEQKAEVEKKLAELRSQLSKNSKEEADEVAKTEEELLAEREANIRDSFQGIGDAIGISGDNLASLFDGIQNGWENAEEQVRAYGQLATEVLGLITEASNKRLEQQLADLEIEKETQLLFAGDSEAARTQIEERFAKKKADIRQKQANNEKSSAVFESAVATAVAVTKALPLIPLSIAVGAIGLAQTAIIAATPVPAFKDGVTGFGGGLALINDQKGSSYQETVRTPDGQLTQYSGRNVLVDLPKGSDVLTATETKSLERMLGENGINGFGDAIYGGGNTSFNIQSKGITENQMDAIFSKHLANRPTNVTNIDKSGINTMIQNGHSKKIIKNNRVTFKSQSV